MVLAARRHHFARSVLRPADFQVLERTCQFFDTTTSLGSNKTFRTSPFLPEVDHEVFKSLETQDSFVQLVSIESLTESPVSDGSAKGIKVKGQHGISYHPAYTRPNALRPTSFSSAVQTYASAVSLLKQISPDPADRLFFTAIKELLTPSRKTWL